MYYRPGKYFLKFTCGAIFPVYLVSPIGLPAYQYRDIDIEIYKIYVEVFEKTISRTEIIDQSFKRKFYEACHRLCKELVRGFSWAQSLEIAVLLCCYVSIVMKIIPVHIVDLFKLPVKF